MLLAPISETPFISYLDHGQGDLEHFITPTIILILVALQFEKLISREY